MRPNEFNIMFYGGRLFQPWLVDMYVKVESMRLDWYSLLKHQKIIQAELYRGIVNMLKAGEARASEVGDSLSYLEILMVVNVMFKLSSLML
jgi:hypothetical protein